MLKIGIECENLEDPKSRWGVGQVTLNLLEEYTKNSEWQKQYKLYLYFKKNVPDDEVLKNPIFIKRVLGFPSFNVFYHILMPLRAMADRLDWMFFPAYQLPPLYLGKSIVMLTQDVYYEYKYGSLPFRYRLSYRIFTNWAARFATKILAISETSKKEVAKLYKINSDRIFVGYLGVNIRNKQQETRNKEEKSENTWSLGRLSHGRYILYVGQAFPRRHLKETILAFEKIVSDFPNLNLVAVGPDKYPGSIINLLVAEINKKLGREAVIHKDRVSNKELQSLYSNTKALVYVSDREAFGLPPMEALAFGVPPVVMDNELEHELFQDYAFYSPQENNPSEALAKEGSLIDNIANTIKQALTDQYKIAKIKSEGSDFVRKYNWRSFAERFFNRIEK